MAADASGEATTADLAAAMAAVDVQRTKLRVRLHPAEGRLEVEGEVTLLARQDGVERVSLVIAEAFGDAAFRVGDAARAARFRPCRWANSAARLWDVSLPGPVARGKRIDLAVRYSGAWQGESLDGRITPRLSWMLPQAPWYPRLGTGRVAEEDASEIDLSVEAPEGHSVVATEGRTPGAAFFIAGDLKIAEKGTWSGKELTWYVAPEADRPGSAGISELRRLLDAETNLFGDYPRPRLAVLQLPAPWPAGEAVAAPGALLFGETAPGAARLAHELAHQWWGMTVQTPLLEGLATYAEWRFAPPRPDPGGSYLDFVTRHADLPIREALYRFEEPQRRALAYDKLAAVLVMLEDVIGAERFGRLLRQFYREGVGRRTRLEEFQSMARSLARQDLDPFFSQWVHQPGLPTVRLERVAVEAEGQKWRLTLTISQGSPPFRLTAPLAVATARGGERHPLQLAGTEQQITLLCRDRPTAVELDPDRRLLLNRKESVLRLQIADQGAR
jgi:hypothetical protein